MVLPVPHSLFWTPFSPQRGTLVHRMPVLEVETMLLKKSGPHWSVIL